MTASTPRSARWPTARWAAARVKIGAADPSTLLQIGLDDKDTTFSGIITGAGSLEKTGTGTQTLTGKGSSIGGDLCRSATALGEGGAR